MATANLSVQVTARVEPLWHIVVKLKFIIFYKVDGSPDFCVKFREHYERN